MPGRAFLDIADVGDYLVGHHHVAPGCRRLWAAASCLALGTPRASGLHDRGVVNRVVPEVNVSNAQPNGQGLANVNPIFTWVRLAHRIPVRIHVDQVPDGVVLAAGMTATVQIDPPSTTK